MYVSLMHKWILGCHQYAEFLRVDRKTPVEAAELFRTTCTQMGLTDSCLALGNMYLVGSGELCVCVCVHSYFIDLSLSLSLLSMLVFFLFVCLFVYVDPETSAFHCKTSGFSILFLFFCCRHWLFVIVVFCLSILLPLKPVVFNCTQS